MYTVIHTTKKLEKFMSGLVQKDVIECTGKLGKWNANIFYLFRKKCLLVSNVKTQYNVLLWDIKKVDLRKVDSLFKDAFHRQLCDVGVDIDIERINNFIGELVFLPTNNDKKTLGFQNQRIQELEYWKYRYERFEDMPLVNISRFLNETPITLHGSRYSNSTTSIEEMKKLLREHIK